MQSHAIKTDNDKVTEIMEKGHIPGASATMIDGDKKIPPTLIGDDLTGNKVTADTKFGVASLSKPVFAYLVLKLIEDNKPGNTPKFFKFNKPFDLKTPLHSIVPSTRLSGCKNIDAMYPLNQPPLPLI